MSTEVLAGMVIERLREAGLDPMAVGQHPMVLDMAREMMQGRSTLSEFIDNCKKLAIINPNLRAKPSEIISTEVIIYDPGKN